MSSIGQFIPRQAPAESLGMIGPVLEVIRAAEAAEVAVEKVQAAAKQAHERIDAGGRLANILLQLAQAKDVLYPRVPGSRNLNYLAEIKRSAARADRRFEKWRAAERPLDQDRRAAERPLDQDRYDDLLDLLEKKVNWICGDVARWNRRQGLARLLTFHKPPRCLPYVLLADIGRLMRWAAELHGLTAEDLYGLQGLRHEDVDASRQEAERQIGERLRSQAAGAVAHLHLPYRPASAEAAVQALIRASTLSAREWDDPLWDTPEPPDLVGGDILLGRFHVAAPTVAGQLRPPATLRFPFQAGVFIDGTGAAGPAAAGLARSLCARLLAAVPAGRFQFTFIDPLSLGGSVADFQHLADYDSRLVGVSAATGQRDIEERLASLSGRVERVNSTCLRGQFATIEDYNRSAAEGAERYHVVVVMGYPAFFSEYASQQLLGLAENGAQCGVHVIAVTDAGREQPRSLSLERLTQRQHRVTWAREPGRQECQAELLVPGGQVRRAMTPDAGPVISFAPDGAPRSPAARLIAASGGRARKASKQHGVSLARLLPVLNHVLATGLSTGLPEVAFQGTIKAADPATWWRGSTLLNAVAPIGLTGAQDVTAMYFSSTEIANGAVMIGNPRSGKTTALHAAILTMCMLYGPEELELYLVDQRQGAGFKIYENLPHARMVAIRSDREFSLAVLESLCTEMRRRGDLMKKRTPGRENITEYREATGEILPRIVLLMDEFQELFELEDRIGQAAFQAFSDIARQGAAVGIHVVMATQTLAAIQAMDKTTLRLLTQRIAFECQAGDAETIMPDNPGPKLLKGQNDGLFNPAQGRVQYNRSFQGLFITPDERDGIVAALQAKAGEGWDRRPRVFDGDSAAPRAGLPAAAGGRDTISIPVGEPFTASPVFCLELRREPGANVILTGDALNRSVTDIPVRGALHSCILAAALAGAEVSILDFVEDEEATEGLTVRELYRTLKLDYSHLSLDYAQRKGAPAVLRRHAELVAARMSEASYSARACVLVISGLQRAAAIRAQPARRSDEDPSADPAASLTTILRLGPEFGVHAVVSCDQAHAVRQKLGRGAEDEFSLRVASDRSTPEDLSYTAGTHGSVARPRSNQLLIGNHFTDTTTRVRGYPPLTATDIADLGKGTHE